MKTFKKLTALILAVLMIVCLAAACGGGGQQDGGDGDDKSLPKIIMTFATAGVEPQTCPWSRRSSTK